MATETWKYPTTSSPTKTLAFLTSGRLQTSSDFIRFNQVQDVTIGGVRMVKNLGDRLNQYEYSVYVPTSSATASSVNADYADVLSFIGSSYANGAVNSFVWTDHESTDRTVRVISDDISVQTVGSYTLIGVTLEEVNT